MLIETLRNADADGRWYTIETLGIQGPAARDAIPLLQQLIKDNRDNERVFCHEAIFRIAPESVDSLKNLSTSLDSGDDQVKLYAMVSLGRIGPTAVEALPSLDPLSLDRSRLIREAASEAVEKIQIDASN